MPFGRSVVTLVSYSDGPFRDELGNYAQVETLITAPGCRHRPLTFKETAELAFNISTELWKTTIPIGEYAPALVAQLMTTQPNDVIRVDGIQYAIVGDLMPFDDFTGPFKATIFSKRHTG